MTIAHWKDDYHVSNLDGDTALYADSEKGFAKEYITIDNTQVQDVFVTCEKLLGRMFPYGLPTCKEEPSNFIFNIFTKYSPYVGEKSIQQNPDQGYVGCNGNAIKMENLAVGKYLVPVHNNMSMTGKINSYTFTVWTTKTKVTLAKQKNWKGFEVVKTS